MSIKFKFKMSFDVLEQILVKWQKNHHQKLGSTERGGGRRKFPLPQLRPTSRYPLLK